MFLTSSSNLLPLSSGADITHVVSIYSFSDCPDSALTSVHQLPVVHDGLRECLATSMRTKLAVEAERLHDWEVRLNREHGRADTLLLAEHLSTTLVEHRVDTTDRILWTLDLDCEVTIR